MSATGLKMFDSTVQTSNVWLNDVMLRLGWTDREKAYRALRAVLQALRDRLGVNEAAHFSAQLPLLLRGVFFEGWHPAGGPHREHRAEFLAHIREPFSFDPDADPEQIARAVFGTIEKHVTEGETAKLKGLLPRDLRALWP